MRNKSKKIDEFIENLGHPLKAEIEAVREIILGANSKIDERIKWGIPGFFYKENLATFNLRAKKYVQVIFHNGAIIEDDSNLLQGDQIDRRFAYFYNIEDIESKKEALIKVVSDWVRFMDK